MKECVRSFKVASARVWSRTSAKFFSPLLENRVRNTSFGILVLSLPISSQREVIGQETQSRIYIFKFYLYGLGYEKMYTWVLNARARSAYHGSQSLDFNP